MISHSTCQPQNSDCVQTKVIVKKSTFSKEKGPTTVILRDSIVRNVYGNIITKSVKYQKQVVVKHFSGAKIADMNHYKKSTQEKSPVEIIIHVGKNDLSSDKEPNDIANDIMQLAKSVKTDANKVAISSILPRKVKFNSKVKGVNTHLQDMCSSNNLPLITHSIIYTHRHINVKGLHLNSLKLS